MPEGDSIRRDDARLAPLVGAAIERVTTQGLARDLAGRVVTSVTPYGKHLTIGLDDGTEIRVRGIAPRAPVATLTDAQLERLYATANRLMKVSSRDYVVYSRTGQPCRTCRTTLQVAQVGDPPRWTWTCPACQRQPTTDHAAG